MHKKWQVFKSKSSGSCQVWEGEGLQRLQGLQGRLSLSSVLFLQCLPCSAKE